MKSQEQWCHNCKFWNITGLQDQSGDCRRRPPVFSEELVRLEIKCGSISEALINASVFPKTYSTDWCGEWEATPEPPPPPSEGTELIE